MKSASAYRVAEHGGLHREAALSRWWSIADSMLCLLSCSLGAVSGLVVGALLGWAATATIVLALALALASCVLLTECPLARRAALALKQYG